MGRMVSRQFCDGLFALLFMFLIVGFFQADAAADPLPLNNADCRKCHRTEWQKVAAAGSQHATKLACMDCHPEHPPKGKQVISNCQSCHSGTAHFEINDCLHCHADPHQPLQSLRDPRKPVKKECLSCHQPVGQMMSAAPSRHAELFCSRCHRQHKQIPACLDCHQPHQQSQIEADCSKCHSGHQPLKIEPASYIPSGLCRPCHSQQADDLVSSMTNHGGINCSYCHKGAHRSITSCQECHGLPHPPAVHSQFRTCLECHGDAHKLISNR